MISGTSPNRIKVGAGGTANGAAKNKLLRTQVGAEEIAEVVSRATGIPVSKLMQGERDKLLLMEERLHQRVIGQEEGISAVANAIRRSRAGLGDPNRAGGRGDHGPPVADNHELGLVGLAGN